MKSCSNDSPRFKRAFAPNPVPKFNVESLNQLADRMIYVCPNPMFDEVIEDDSLSDMYASLVEKALDDFSPEEDVLVSFGDPLILAMMIFWLSDCEFVYVGRYSKKTETYKVKKIKNWW